MCGLRKPMWPSLPEIVAAPISFNASIISLGGRVISGICVIPGSRWMKLPVCDRTVAALQVRRFPETKALCLDRLFVDLDAEPRQIADRIVGAVEPWLHGEE